MKELVIMAQNVVGGLGIGSIYAMVALGYSLVYRSMGLVNFAHASIFMIGSYFGIMFYMGLMGFKLPFLASFLIGVLMTAVLGAVLERVLRPLAHLDMMFMLLGTIGVGIMLDNLAIILWGSEGLSVPAPIPNNPVHLGGVTLMPYTLLFLVMAAVIMIGIQVFFKYTWFGRAMRAAAQDREIAAAMGIPVNTMNALSLALGSALAAAAGILAAPIFYLSPTMDAAVGIKGFAAAILGGFGNVPGAVVGGLILGIIESLSAGFISSDYQAAISFILLTLVLLFRPAGLLGDETIEKV